MGGGQSREEQLYQAVQSSNHTAVKSLRRDGTSLEWTDKDGRTPLILACTKGELFDMVITLLNLGASIKAFRPGSHGGYPLHHAAKRGLDKTVILLLSRGGDPLAINDDGQTPLDMARNRGHVSVVRIIEDRICLFSGVMREISGPSFLEAIAPQWVTRKIWAVVLPSAQSRRIVKHELVIYQSPKVSLPRIIIALSKVQIDEPNYSLADPVMILTDKSSKTRFKFLAEFEGRRPQLEKFFKACKGIVEAQTSPQNSVSPTRTRSQPVQIAGAARVPAPVSNAPQSVAASSPPQRPGKRPPPKEAEIPEDVALAMAINASIQSANEEGLVLSPTTSSAAAEMVQHLNSLPLAEQQNWPQFPSPQPEQQQQDQQQQQQQPQPQPQQQQHWSGQFSPPNSTGGISRPRKRAPLTRKWSDSTTSSSSTQSDGNSGGSLWGSPEAGPSRSAASAGPLDLRTSSPQRTGTPKRILPPLVRNVPVRGSTSVSSSEVPIEIFAPAYPPPPPPPLPEASPAPPAVPAAPRVVPVAGAGGVKNKAQEVVSRGDGNGNGSGGKSSEEKSPASGQCVVCWDAPARGVCIPCGHLAGCMACLKEIKDKSWGCPVCRTSIQQIVKVFTV